MKEQPQVSIIVPVYNVENYIERCLNSLVNQTFKDIEIITINDGSTDKSLELLNKYAKEDIRISVIDLGDEGVSYCRNLGIEKANGKYIMFVDSDDWIDSSMVEVLYKKAEENKLDLVMCSYIREFKDHSKEKIFNLPQEIIYKEDKVKNELLRKLVGPIKEELSNPEMLDALGTVWGKLYRADILKENKIKFVDLKEIGSAEDTLFNIFTFNYLSKVMFLNKPMYHYWRDNPKSVTSQYNPKLKEQRKVFFKYISDFIKENNFEQVFEEALNNRICTSILGLGLMECSKNNKINGTNKIKNIKNLINLINEEYIREAYMNLELKYFSIHWRIFYFFIKNKMSFCSYLMLSTIEFLRAKI